MEKLSFTEAVKKGGLFRVYTKNNVFTEKFMTMNEVVEYYDLHEAIDFEYHPKEKKIEITESELEHAMSYIFRHASRYDHNLKKLKKELGF